MALPEAGRLLSTDLDAAMVIEKQVFKEPWSRHMYLTDMKHNRHAVYLALRPAAADAGRLPPLLAYGGLWLVGSDAHIATIASHPDWRGCGLGQYLMLSMLDAGVARGAIRSTLEVRVGNTNARRLYEKLGYSATGTRRRYYSDGEDAVLMATPPLAGPEMQALLIAARIDAEGRLSSCFTEVR